MSTTVAQQDLESLTGEKVRIRAPQVSHKWIEGVLYPTGPESFELIRGEFRHDTVKVTLAGVRRLQVAEDKRSNMLLGAVVGTVLGAGLGFGRGILHDESEESTRISFDELALGVGLGVGFIVGTYLGSRSESDVWRDIPVGRLSRAPAPGGAAIALRLTQNIP